MSEVNEIKFLDYTSESAEAKLFDEINPGSLTDENIQGTLGSLTDLRNKIAGGEEYANPFAEQHEKNEIFSKILLLMKEEIEQAKAGEGQKEEGIE